MLIAALQKTVSFSESDLKEYIDSKLSQKEDSFALNQISSKLIWLQICQNELEFEFAEKAKDILYNEVMENNSVFLTIVHTSSVKNSL